MGNNTSLLETYQGKTVIVTGGSTGMGEEYVKQLSELKANIVTCAISSDAADLERVTAHLDNVTAIVCDLGKRDDCKALIEKTIEMHGTIDYMFLNAAAVMYDLFDDLQDPLDLAERTMQVNYLGNVYLIHYATHYLLESNGLVAFSSSMAGWVPMPMTSLYAASKAALNQFIQCYRMENRNLNLSLCAIGSVATRNQLANTEGTITVSSVSPRVAVNQLLEGAARRLPVIIAGQPSWQFFLLRWLHLHCPSIAEGIIMRMMSESIDMIHSRRTKI